MKKIVFIAIFFLTIISLLLAFFLSSNKSFTNQSETESFQNFVNSSFEKVKCPVRESKLNESFYTGKLIDTHIHMPSIPDDANFKADVDEIRPALGINVKIDDYICMMNYENTDKVFAFFPVWDPIRLESLEIVKITMEKYPEKFVPFIMPPDHDDRIDGYPTVDAVELERMLSVYPDLFKGYGEIGLYERGDNGGPKGAKELPPDSERLNEIYPVIRENNLVVYFHLGEGQKESFEKVLRENRDISFIFHGDQLVNFENGEWDLSAIEEILENNPNAYYGVDEIYGQEFILKPETSKEEFIAHFSNYKPLIDRDIKVWKEFIEKHQNQVLWGTDRGWSADWSLDTDVAQTLNDYSRYFIAQLSPEVQEKYAYKNAERLLGN